MSIVTPRRLTPVAVAALVLSGLALLATAAGVGYAAGKIGTDQIENKAITSAKLKNNAVKSSKIKDGSVTVRDLRKQQKNIEPALSNGGEGDCVWSSDFLLPDVQGPIYRKDFFGRVHLAGLAVSSDGPGGDATCDPNAVGQVADGIPFTLPAGYIPPKHIFAIIEGSFVFIIGKDGYSEPGVTLPPGTVYSSDGAVVLDGISFDPAGSPSALPRMTAQGQAPARFEKRLR
jgi:hypothetical protein